MVRPLFILSLCRLDVEKKQIFYRQSRLTRADTTTVAKDI
jgi:hypothetical protein